MEASKALGLTWAKKALCILMAVAIAWITPVPRAYAQDDLAAQAPSTVTGADAAADAQAAPDAAEQALSAQSAQVPDVQAQVAADVDAMQPQSVGEEKLYTDEIGIKWRYRVVTNDATGAKTIAILGRLNSPEEDGLNWVVPDKIEGLPVTQMVGSTNDMIDGVFSLWFGGGGNANTLTFPATLQEMKDTSGNQYFLGYDFGSGYENYDRSKNIYFLGPCPEGLNPEYWVKWITDSDLRRPIYVLEQYYDDWVKSLPSTWTKTTVKTFEAPTGVRVVRADDDTATPVTNVTIPINRSVLFTADNLPLGGKFEKVHSALTWTSDNPYVSVWGQDGYVHVLRGATAGETATVTVSNALRQTYTFTVTIGEEPEDDYWQDANGIEWYYTVNEGYEGDYEQYNGTVTITGIRTNHDSLAGTDLIIPAYINDKGIMRKVTCWGDGGILNDLALHSVTFPETLAYILEGNYELFQGALSDRTDGRIIFLGGAVKADWEGVMMYQAFFGQNELWVADPQDWKDNAGFDAYDPEWSWVPYMNKYTRQDGIAITDENGVEVSAAELAAGTSTQLFTRTDPDYDGFYAGHSGVVWTSSDESIATVGADGTVTAVAGAAVDSKATITATSALAVAIEDDADRAKFTKTYEVTVTAAPEAEVIGTLAFSPEYPAKLFYNNGNPVMPQTVVTDGAKTLEEGVDYTLTYQKKDGSEWKDLVTEADPDNGVHAGLPLVPQEVGEYKAVFTGLAPYYKETKSFEFEIVNEVQPVAGWTFTLNNDATSTTLEDGTMVTLDDATITLTGYAGATGGTIAIPGSIGGHRVKELGANALSGIAADLLVVPDNIATLNTTLSGVSAVKFLGVAPSDLATAVPNGTAVTCLAAYADGFADYTPTTIADTDTATAWKYYVAYDFGGNMHGVLGSAVAATDTDLVPTGCQLAANNRLSFELPESLDGFALSEIGERALGTDDTTTATMDFNTVTVPLCYTAIGDEALLNCDAVLLFQGAPLMQMGDKTAFVDAGAICGRWTEVYFPLSYTDLWEKPWGASNVSWAPELRGSYDERFQMEFGFDDPYGDGFIDGRTHVVVTGYNGKIGTSLELPSVSNTFQLKIKEFRDSQIDGRNLRNITMPGKLAYETVSKMNGECFNNLRADCSIHFLNAPPASDDPQNVFKRADGLKATIYVEPEYYESWKTSAWNTYYNIELFAECDQDLFNYYQDSQGKLYITSYRGYSANVRIPEQVADVRGADGNKVSGTIAGLYAGAFYGSDVATVIVPSTVKSFGDSAFENSAIKNLLIEEGVESFGERCFWGAGALKKLDIPNSVKTIGGFAFTGSGITDFTVGGETVATITQAGTSQHFRSLNGVLYDANLDNPKLVAYPVGRTEATYNVPEGTKVIGVAAFRDANTDAACLHHITLPEGLAEIQSYAFQNCVDLEDINLPDSIDEMGVYVFEFDSSLTALTFPRNLSEVPEGFAYGTGIKNLVLPGKSADGVATGVKKIGEMAFASCAALESVTLPEGLTEVGPYAFSQDSLIQTLTLPSTLKKVGEGAFNTLTLLQELKLEDTAIEEIGAGAFAGLGTVTKIVVPNTVKSLGEMAFAHCPYVAELTLEEPTQYTAIPQSCFSGMYYLKSVTIPATITSIGEYAFFNDVELSAFLLNRNEVTYGDYSFGRSWDIESTNAAVYGYTTSNGQEMAEINGVAFYPIDININSHWPDFIALNVGDKQTLRVDASCEAPGAELSYSWSIDLEGLDGATSPTYTYNAQKGGRHVVTATIASNYDPTHPETMTTIISVGGDGNGTSLADAARLGPIPDQDYTGKPITPRVAVTQTGGNSGMSPLIENFDYKVEYFDNVKPGTARVKVTGINAFNGELWGTFTINACSLDGAVGTIAKQGFTGDPLQPAVVVKLGDETLRPNVDYTVTYTNNTLPGTGYAIVTGTGAYTGTLVVPFVISSEFSGNMSDVTVAAIPDHAFTGEAIEPTLTVTDAGTRLVQGVDYEVSYKDNVNTGVATVTVRGIGAYSGTRTATFNIGHTALVASMGDLDPNAWYMTPSESSCLPGTNTLYVDYAIAKGLMTGYTDAAGNVTGFGPDDNLSRAQAATVLYRMAQPHSTDTTDPAAISATRNASGLTDVEDGKYYTAAVNWAVKEGIITGYNGTKLFGPNDNVTREQLATMIFRLCTGYANQPIVSKSIAGFDDYNMVSSWARQGHAFCLAKGIITGYAGQNKLGPQDLATRAQMAKIVSVVDMSMA